MVAAAGQALFQVPVKVPLQSSAALQYGETPHEPVPSSVYSRFGWYQGKVEPAGPGELPIKFQPKSSGFVPLSPRPPHAIGIDPIGSGWSGVPSHASGGLKMKCLFANKKILM